MVTEHTPPPPGATLMVSFPQAFPASPSAERNILLASHRWRHSSRVRPASSKLWRLRARPLPPTVMDTRPSSTRFSVSANLAARFWRRRAFWNLSERVA